MRRYMPSGRRVAGIGVVVTALGALVAGGPSPAVTTTGAVAPEIVSATLRDQTELAVTVYNSNVALVRDVRNVSLPSGTLDLRFLDIAATVNPATVHFRSLSEPARLGILEQNYQFDLLDPQRLLKKYIGRDVTLVRTRMENGTTRQEEVTARLLAFNDAPVWRIGERDRHGAPRRAAAVPGDPREPSQPPHAGLEGRQHGPAAAPHRDVVPGDEHVVDGRLRPHRRARRRTRRS